VHLGGDGGEDAGPMRFHHLAGGIERHPLPARQR
jgi:hypothetical protein